MKVDNSGIRFQYKKGPRITFRSSNVILQFWIHDVDIVRHTMVQFQYECSQKMI